MVGLGRMGANMARRLKETGWKISSLHDANPSVTHSLSVELGAEEASTPAEVTAASEVVFTVVSDDNAMESIYFGENPLFQDAAGKIFVNCATISPSLHRKLEDCAKEFGAFSLEACMASSIPQARNGSLFLMIGGEKAVFEKLSPLFSDLSQALHYVGEAGKAAEVKALVNMVMNTNTAALAEGLGLGVALGIDPSILCSIFRQTGAASRVLDTDAPDMIAREHDCFFSAAHAAKDSRIALTLATQAGVPAPVALAACGQFEKLVSLGLGELDKSAVSEITFPGRLPTEATSKIS